MTLIGTMFEAGCNLELAKEIQEQAEQNWRTQLQRGGVSRDMQFFLIATACDRLLLERGFSKQAIAFRKILGDLSRTEEYFKIVRNYFVGRYFILQGGLTSWILYWRSGDLIYRYEKHHENWFNAKQSLDKFRALKNDPPKIPEWKLV